MSATRTYKVRERKPRQTMFGKRPIKQRIWDYMRRRKVFTPREIMTILEVNQNTLRSFLYPLMVAGFIQRKKVAEGKNKVLDSTYVFVAKDAVIQAPLVKSTEVYCYYSKTSCDIGARTLLKGALEQMSQGQVAQRLGISKTTINLLVHNKYPNPAEIYKKIREVF